MEELVVLDHPAVADRIARVRDAATPTPVFRRLIEELGAFIAYEATRALETVEARVDTPIAAARVRRIARRPVVAPILRAGLGLLPGFLSVIDEAIVAHLGFFRDPETLAAIPYYANLPHDLAGVPVYLLDPMLATGNSAIAAIELLAAHGATDLWFLSVLAAPEGVRAVRAAHPRARLVTCALDHHLNDHGYIVPGLGDAGDRMFGSTSSVPVSFRAPVR